MDGNHPGTTAPLGAHPLTDCLIAAAVTLAAFAVAGGPPLFIYYVTGWRDKRAARRSGNRRAAPGGTD